ADKALPAEGHHVRVRCTPPRERRRPFLRATEVEPFVTGADDAAVHEARYHHFVEHCETVDRLLHSKQRATFTMPRESGEIWILESRSNLRRLPERRMGR